MPLVVLLLLMALPHLAAQPAAAPLDWLPDQIYAQRDGMVLKLDLAKPKSADGKHPLVVCIHGGAWMWGDKTGYQPVLRMLAASGYVAVSLDYGLAPRNRFPQQLEDIRTALGYLAKRSSELGIDVSRTALLGDSAGGHLAMMAAFSPPAGQMEPVKVLAIVNIFGPSDLTTWKLATPDGKIEGLTTDQILESAFGTSDRRSDALRDASPVHWIRAGGPAVLSLHGDADPVVAVAQSEGLHRGLREAGVAERLEVLSGAGHNLVGPHLQRATTLTMEHLGQYLAAQKKPSLPTADEVVRRYVQAMGGEAALSKMKSRAFGGSISVSTYGAYGEYQEIAKGPDKYLRIFRFPGYAPMERGYDGKRGWEESPDYGIEKLLGDRLSEVRRQAVFHPALEIRSIYKKLSMKGRDTIDGQEAVVLDAVTPDGAQDTLWFDLATGLLLGIESTETFANGVKQRVLYLFEDYKAVDGVQVAHGVRYESPRLIYVLKRQVIHNPPIEDSRFRPPNERQ